MMVTDRIELEDVMGFVVDRDEAHGRGRPNSDDLAKLAVELLEYFDLSGEYEYDPESQEFSELEDEGDEE